MTKPLVIITGASSGIGAGIATLFSQTGYSLGLLARNLQALEAMKLPNALCIETDVSDEKSVLNAVKLSLSTLSNAFTLSSNHII